MEEFFTGDNWVRNLIMLLISLGILVFAMLSFFSKKRKGTKTAKVKNSKKVKVKQSEDGDARVRGSEDVEIQQ